MLPEDRDAAHLWDMLDAARHLLDFTVGLRYETYLEDVQLRWTVERGLTIIGEAARRVSPDLKVAHPELPWRWLISQRNIIVHEYDELDQQRVWEVVTTDLLHLIAHLEALLPPPPQDPDPR